MIESYEIQEDTLILHLNFQYEFGGFGSSKKESIWKQIKDYMEQQRITFDGTKVVLMVGGLAIATLFFPPNIKSEMATLKPPSIFHELKIPDFEKEEPADEIGGTSTNDPTSLESSIKEEPITPPHSESSTKEESTSAPHLNVSEETKPEVSGPVERMVTITRSNGTILTLTMEDYLVGVVAAEMPVSFSSEALKAGAVVARTYALKKIEQGQQLTDSVSTQAFLDETGRRQLWGTSYATYEEKIRSAVKETVGEVLTYQGRLIDAVYHSTSNGKTESAVHVWGNSVPYLVSVESPWDLEASSYLRVENKELNVVMQLLGVTFDDLEQMELLSRDESGRVKEVRIGSTVYLGTNLRNLLGLRSTDFEFAIENGNLVITTRGYGHGVGMGQYGANGMAKAGYSYEQILTHYYTGVQLEQRF